MDEHVRVMRAALSAAEAGREHVVLTVLSAKGSTPREVGAKMVVEVCGGEGGEGAEGVGGVRFVGTIGGGRFEHLAIDDARRYVKEKRSGVERYVLGAEAEQCCGGVMEVFFEYRAAAVTVVVFGAGHVSAEVSAVLTRAGGGGAVRVVVCDDRAEWAREDRFAGAAIARTWEMGLEEVKRAGERAIALVMTCSHETDYALVRAMLKEERMAGFVGLIGSRSKRACLFGRLAAEGIDAERIGRVVCPIGVGNMGKEPAMVAVSISAQVMLAVHAMRGGGGKVVGGAGAGTKSAGVQRVDVGRAGEGGGDE